MVPRKWKYPMFAFSDACVATPEPASVYQVAGYKAAGGCSLYETDTTDQLITDALAEMDSNKRIVLHWKLGQYVYDNYFAVPLVLKNALYAVSARVGEMPMAPGKTDAVSVIFDQITAAK